MTLNRRVSNSSMLVAFLDLLGFASGIEKLSPDDEQTLMENLGRWDQNNGHLSLNARVSTNVHQVYNAYVSFHEVLGSELLKLQSEARKHDWVSKIVVFSDSTFLSIEGPDEKPGGWWDEYGKPITLFIETIERIMQQMSIFDVPVRGGIAIGSFDNYAITSMSHPAGNLSVSCPFFGSGVVRAYYAESRPLSKGCRIFIHDSAKDSLEPLGCIVPLLGHECDGIVSSELNLLPRFDNYDGVVGQVKDRLTKMRATAPTSAFIHYDASLLAIERMAVARPPIQPPPEGYNV